MFKVLLIFLILPVLLVESFCKRHPQVNLATALTRTFEYIPKKIQHSIEETMLATNDAINVTVYQLNVLEDSLEPEIGFPIQQTVSNLIKISEQLTSSRKKDFEEMSAVLKDAISSTQSIAKKLEDFAENLIPKYGSQTNHVTKTILAIAFNFKKSINEAVAELNITLRFVANRMEETAKQIKVAIDSNNLVGVTNARCEAQFISGQKLIDYWKIFGNITDFQNINQSAVVELSDVLKYLDSTEVDFVERDNCETALLTFFIAIGIFVFICCVVLGICIWKCLHCCLTSLDDIEIMEGLGRSSMEEKNRSLKDRENQFMHSPLLK